jgi:hypothetical protein
MLCANVSSSRDELDVRRDGSAPAEGTTSVYFMHIIKAAGTSLTWSLYGNIPWQLASTRWTAGQPELASFNYANSRRFLNFSERDHAGTQLYLGHYPFVAKDFIPGPVQVVSVVRPPVDRTLSYLAQCQQHLPDHHGRPLEAIYEDPQIFCRVIENHQTKMFSMTRDEAVDDPVEPHWTEEERALVHRARLTHPYVTTEQARALGALGSRFPAGPNTGAFHADETRLRNARSALEQLDYLGTVDTLDRLLDALVAGLGFAFGKPPHLNDGLSAQVPEAFRRRIERDNAADMELYDHAVRLIDRRGCRPTDR